MDSDKGFPKQRKKRRAPKKITQSYLENAGLYYLERYASSAANFRRIMRRKIDRSAKYHEQEADDFYPMLESIITRYRESGLLNDELYSFSKVRSLRQRGNSERMIYAKLIAKGLNTEQIAQALEEYARDQNVDSTADIEYAAAEKYARKRRLGPYRQPQDRERYEKDMAAMARAGFSFDIVKSVLGDKDALEER